MDKMVGGQTGSHATELSQRIQESVPNGMIALVLLLVSLFAVVHCLDVLNVTTINVKGPVDAGVFKRFGVVSTYDAGCKVYASSDNASLFSNLILDTGPTDYFGCQADLYFDVPSDCC